MQNELILSEQSENGELILSQNAAQFIERFLADADIAPTTKETYRKALRQFFLWYASRGGGDLARADILSYKQAQLSRMQANTVGAYLSALRSFFKWLESEKLYPNVAAGVKGVKLSNGHRKDALTPTQVGRVLETLKGSTLQAKRDYALFNLLVRTGLRTIEIERANVEDMRNKGAVTVLYVQGKGRSQKDEFVVLTDAAVRPIYAYLAARRAEGREVMGPESPLFASLSTRTYGKRLVTRSLRGIVKKALRTAGYDDARITTHSLRHTSITLALLGGASIQQAQALARHGNIGTTMIYSHALDRLNDAPEYAIGKMLDFD
ncbi:MAG: tyrosine-type recombinase/integrase [Eggerthellaceae bacterium]|nr:tyrosine-type recombinase/integrase [Eggerthellaceae bacterium]